MTTPAAAAPSTGADTGVSEVIRSGQTSLGIELGSTRIKACLVGPAPNTVLANGSYAWENEFVDRTWTYSLDSVWSGVRAAYAELVADVKERYGVTPTTYGAIGVSGMMHGYLVFDAEDQLLVPFRTWRNTNTVPAAAELSELFGINIPLRWSIAHLYQAILDDEPHVPRARFFTTLAGYIHWQLTDMQVLGVGDASGMFPIDSATGDYDARMLEQFDTLIDSKTTGLRVTELLPQVLTAGEAAGELTASGAAHLDPTSTLQSNVPLCPPEGDAGTGMVATNSVAPRTGNVSVGTSIFAMVVLERPLGSTHQELDLVTTPNGSAVAMVHCNNGASELAAWAGMFSRFTEASGAPVNSDTVFETLLGEALEGEADAGGLVAYNHLAGEPIAGLAEGRPLFVRTPDSRLTLANFARSQVYGVFGTLSLGMQVLDGEDVAIDRMLAHGGMFRTAGVAQQMLAGALRVPVAVGETASEGGAWGIAVLASYLSVDREMELGAYLNQRVFADANLHTVEPNPQDVVGYAAFLDRYRAGLDVMAAAIKAF